MKSKKTLIAVAFAGAVSWAGAASADGMKVSDPYRGWGPMANLDTPYSPNESATLRYDEEMRVQMEHLMEVEQARDTVWASNAHLRMVNQSYAMTSESRPNPLFAPFRTLARFIQSQGHGSRSAD